MQETSNSNLISEETKSDSNKRHLKIATLDQQVYTLEVPPSISIRELKKEIEAKTDVPFDRQRLIYQAKMLNDDQHLDSIIKEDGQTIHLLAKTQAAPTNNQPSTTQNINQQNQPQSSQSTSQNPNTNPTQGIFIGGSGMPTGLNINSLLSGLLGGLPGPNLSSNISQQNNPSQQNQPGMQGTSPRPQAEVIGFNLTITAMENGQPIVTHSNIQNPQSQQSQTIQANNTTSQTQQNASNTSTSNQNQRLIELPHRHVFNIGTIVNSLMGINSSFPGPSMPQTGLPRNSLTLLGGFLYNYQFQLLRLVPFLARLADLLQRESLITNPQERAQLESLAHSVGTALEELAQATNPVTSLFRNIQIGSSPGEFRMLDRVYRPVNSQQNPNISSHTRPSQNPQPSNLSNSGPNLVASNLQNLSSILNPSQSSSQNPTTQSTQSPQGLGSLNIGPMMQMMTQGNMFSQSLNDMISSSNEMVSEEEECILAFIGPLQISDLLSIFTSGNVSCFDRVHSQIRQKVQQLVAKYEGKDKFAEKIATLVGKLFELDEEAKELAMEGFEPNTVATELSTPHLSKIIESSLKTYDNSSSIKYSNELVSHFKHLTKEVLTEVGEGFHNGFADLQLILRTKFSSYIAGLVGAETAEMFMGLLWPNLWKKIESLKDSPVMMEEEKTNIENSGDKQKQEEELLMEIAKSLATDTEKQNQLVRTPLSEAYMKGDIHYQEK